MSLAGERLHTPFPQSTPPGNPSHLDTPNSRSGRGVAIPNSQLLGCIQARQHPYPALRPYEQSLAVQTLILVRKPPRERLAASRSSVEHDEPPALLARVAGKSPPDFGQQYHAHSDCSPTRTDASPSSTVGLYADLLHYHYDQRYTTQNFFHAPFKSQGGSQSTADDESASMLKKRRTSIQAILVPSFLQGTLSPTTSPPPSPTALTSRMRAHSAATPTSPSASTSTFVSTAGPDSSQPGVDKRAKKRSLTFSSARTSPPLDFLLDDDPFANLTSAPSESLRSTPVETIPTPPIPHSPLNEPGKIPLIMASSPKASVPVITSPPPIPLPRTRPAHQRPAFKSRPSLPSLDTLARMNVVLTKKVRKGRVGAGLPFEPWDNLPSDDDFLPPTPGHLRQNTNPSNSLPPFVYADGFPSPQNLASQPISNPQPLLPSQIMALGSIAANVEMVIPTVTTPKPQPASSTSPAISSSPEGLVDNAVSYDVEPATPTYMPAATSSPGVIVDNAISYNADSAPPTPVALGDAIFSEAAYEAPEETTSPIEDDGYAADFLERYHQSSEDGHDVSPITVPTPLSVVDVLPVLHELETASEEFDKEKAITAAAVEQGVVPVSEESMSHNGGDHQDEEMQEELEEISFAENQSFLHLGPPSRDETLFMHSGSMLFSSSPSSFSLSQSLSSTSSRASSESMGIGEYAEYGDAEEVVFGSISPRKDHKYRRLVNPSLSSLELDLDASLGSGSDRNEQEMGNSTSRSSSGRPSLSRTRSSSDYSSDVVRSPSMEDYAFFPYRNHQSPALQQLTASFSQQSTPVTEELVETFISDGGQLFSVKGEDGVLGASLNNMFGEYRSDLIGEGFGFGFDKVLPAAEDLEVKAEADDVESENLVPSTSPSVPKLAADASKAAADVNFSPSPVSDDQHQPINVPQPLIVQQATPPPTPNFSQTQLTQEEMPRLASSSSRPSSAIKTTATPDLTDATRPQAAHGGQGSSSSSAVYKGNSSSASATVNSYRRGYASATSRGYGGRGREDDDEDDQRRRRRALERGHGGEAVVNQGFLEDSSEDESECYTSAASSLPSKKSKLERPRMSRSPSRSPGNYASPLPSGSNMRGYTKFPNSTGGSRYVSEEEDEDSEDDDMPLAQVIPGALTAQKTIRRQVREEREQRKREKALRINTDSQRDRQTTLRPAGAGSGVGGGDLGSSSSRDAAAIAAAAVLSATASLPQGRQRTLTLPGKAPSPAVLNPHDLARKLQSVQMADVTSPTYPMYAHQLPQSPQNLVQSPSHPTQPSVSHSKSFSRPSADFQRPLYPTPPQTSSSATSPAARSRSIRQPTPAQPFTSPTGTNPPPLPTLRPMRSFHRPSERSPAGIDEPRSLAVPADEERRSRTSATSVTPARGSHESQHHRSLSLSRRSTERERAERVIPVEPVPALPSNIRTSYEEHRKLTKSHPEQKATTSTRTSAEGERLPRTSNQHPPPPIGANWSPLVTQQRVFVGNLQQFHMVEIGPGTAAGDVVALMESQGALVGWAGMGGWMVFEIAQDFGMERPIRSYELLVDIQSSWLKDKTVNYFMLKLTPLAAPLSRSAIPTSSPTHSGYIEWESKRGKWSKRWVQLKEHSLYLSKRDNGKDQVLICSLSNFDAYHVTRPYKAPKAFTFAVKSTDKLSFFENTDDYMHTFSCSEKDGKFWMEKILIARSYLLYQERNVLFGSKPNGNSTPTKTPLARSGTRKTSSSAAQRPIQPLVNLPPFSVSAAHSLPHADVFEPGSLLSRQS